MNTKLIQRIKDAGLITIDGRINAVKIRWINKGRNEGLIDLLKDIQSETSFLDIYSNLSIATRIKAILLDINKIRYCSCGKLCLFSGYKDKLYDASCGDRLCTNNSIKESALNRDYLVIEKTNISKKENIKNTLENFKNDFLNSDYKLLNVDLLRKFINIKINRNIFEKNHALVIYKDFIQHKDELSSILKLTEYIPIEFNKSGNMTWNQRFYHILNNITEIPKCTICKKNNIQFTNLISGYVQKTCNKCKCISSGYNRRINQIDDIRKKLDKDNCELIISDISQFGLNISPIEIKCKKCDNVFNKWLSNGATNRIHNICPICYPTFNGRSKPEIEVFNYIKSLGLDCKSSDRSIINPLELDIAIPSKKLAIEFNGNYWHTENQGKDELYHITKTNMAESAGYKLIHIFEDEWIYKEKIVKSRLRAILGLTRYSIGARKCEVREISNKLKDQFLEKYHIQGSDKSSTRLGLFLKNRLVAVMTFSKSRFNKNYDYELVRYATIANFNIIGGAGKLLKYFKNNNPNKSIISYADRRWSRGNLYEKLGFKLIHTSAPNYWYISKDNDLTRLSRHQFMKHKLKDKLEKFDENLSEVENMKINGYDRIFDCGNLVFELS